MYTQSLYADYYVLKTHSPGGTTVGCLRKIKADGYLQVTSFFSIR